MKVLVAMSGGVDSSVAACLLKEQGHDCVGCTMKLHSEKDIPLDEENSCCTTADVEDARRVAAGLGMPFHLYDFGEEFRTRVVEPFINAYLNGRTPNPCIECNHYLKFGVLHRKARELGCDAIATGHYARIEKQGDKYVLKKALDPSKDQSYVLYTMTQEQLAHTLFPLGEMSKPQARAIAEQDGLVNADKPDSQDICFVPDGDYAAVIQRYTGADPLPGEFVDAEGRVLGTHRGILHYTIGQRKGLGISAKAPLYVCKIDAAANRVVLGSNEDLFTTHAMVRDFHWISGETPTAPVRCKAKLRYRHPEQPATVIPLGDDRVEIIFDAPQRAVTPGQSAVLYLDDVVLGGGIQE